LVSSFAVGPQPAGPPLLIGVGGAGAIDIGERALFAPLFLGNPPQTDLRYQWRKNGVDIAGATFGTPRTFQWKKVGQPIFTLVPGISFTVVAPEAHNGVNVLKVTNVARTAVTSPVTVTDHAHDPCVAPTR
jgi:hypothetical protein